MVEMKIIFIKTLDFGSILEYNVINLTHLLHYSAYILQYIQICCFFIVANRQRGSSFLFYAPLGYGHIYLALCLHFYARVSQIRF